MMMMMMMPNVLLALAVLHRKGLSQLLTQQGNLADASTVHMCVA